MKLLYFILINLLAFDFHKIQADDCFVSLKVQTGFNEHKMYVSNIVTMPNGFNCWGSRAGSYPDYVKNALEYALEEFYLNNRKKYRVDNALIYFDDDRKKLSRKRVELVRLYSDEFSDGLFRTSDRIDGMIERILITEWNKISKYYKE